MQIKYLSKDQLMQAAKYAAEHKSSPSLTVENVQALSPYYRYPIELILFHRDDKDEVVVNLVISSPGEIVSQVLPTDLFEALPSMEAHVE